MMIWEEFGTTVAKARADKGLTLAQVAEATFGSADRRATVLRVEQGSAVLTSDSLRALARVLDLPDSATAALLTNDLPAEDGLADTDRTAAALMRASAADPDIAPPSEALLVALASTFAIGPHADLQTAQNGLRAALQAAADIAALATVAGSPSDPALWVIRHVADLNDQGHFTLAGAALDQALAALDAGQTLYKTALTEVALRQDRIRNAPQDTAQRLLAQLRGVAQPGGLFRALHDLWEGWFDRGKTQSLGFDLNTALHLARANVDRTKGVQNIQALADLGITQHELGVQEGRADRLKHSIASFRAVVAAVKPKTDPEFWVGGMTNLAMSLARLGEQETGTTRLEEAVKTYRATLALLKRDRAPQDWAMVWGNMAEAMSRIADRTANPALAQQALQQLEEAGAVLTDDATTDRIARAQAVIQRLL